MSVELMWGGDYSMVAVNQLSVTEQDWYQAVNPQRLNVITSDYICPNVPVITFAKSRPTKPEGAKCTYI